jgi:hypothetical protein
MLLRHSTMLPDIEHVMLIHQERTEINSRRTTSNVIHRTC